MDEGTKTQDGVLAQDHQGPPLTRSGQHPPHSRQSTAATRLQTEPWREPEVHTGKLAPNSGVVDYLKSKFHLPEEIS